MKKFAQPLKAAIREVGLGSYPSTRHPKVGDSHVDDGKSILR